MDKEALVEGMTAEIHDTADIMRKFEALMPDHPGRDADLFATAVGAFWFTILGTLRKRPTGDVDAAETELEARLIAAIISPSVVSWPEAVAAAQRHSELKHPTTKA